MMLGTRLGVRLGMLLGKMMDIRLGMMHMAQIGPLGCLVARSVGDFLL